jgi:hypothetical protein
MTTSDERYPQHAKLKKVSDKTQFVHDFLTFCEGKGISLQTEDGVYKRHADLLYEFTGIDQWKLEDEKRSLIEDCRKMIDSSRKKR